MGKGGFQANAGPRIELLTKETCMIKEICRMYWCFGGTSSNIGDSARPVEVGVSLVIGKRFTPWFEEGRLAVEAHAD